MDITMKTTTGKMITQRMSPSDSIYNVKTRICLMEGIHPHQHSLIFSDTVLENDRTLTDYNIPSKAILHLVATLVRPANSKIFVKNPTGNTIAVDINPSDTIGMVIERIGKVEEFLPGKLPALVSDGKLLSHGVTLGQYNIQEDSTLLLVHLGVCFTHCITLHS